MRQLNVLITGVRCLIQSITSCIQKWGYYKTYDKHPVHPAPVLIPSVIIFPTVACNMRLVACLYEIVAKTISYYPK